MFHRKIFPAFSAGLLFVAVSAFGQTLFPTAMYTMSSNLPPVGLAITETAQVNVVNTAVGTTLQGAAAVPVCSGSIAFYNVGGSIIGTATSFTVGSGKIFSAALPYASAGAAGSRTVIRPVITVIPPAISIAVTGPIAPVLAIPACSLSSSLETFDTTTGVTHVFVAGAAPTGTFGVLKGILPANSMR